MNVGTAVFAVVDFESQQAKHKEETGHSKADPVHCRVAHQVLARVTSFNAFTEIFKKGNLREKKIQKLPVRAELCLLRRKSKSMVKIAMCTTEPRLNKTLPSL